MSITFIVMCVHQSSGRRQTKILKWKINEKNTDRSEKWQTNVIVDSNRSPFSAGDWDTLYLVFSVDMRYAYIHMYICIMYIHIWICTCTQLMIHDKYECETSCIKFYVKIMNKRWRSVKPPYSFTYISICAAFKPWCALHVFSINARTTNKKRTFLLFVIGRGVIVVLNYQFTSSFFPPATFVCVQFHLFLFRIIFLIMMMN